MAGKQHRVVSAATVPRAGRYGGPISAATGDLSLLQNVQICNEAHTAFHSIGDKFVSLGVRRPWREPYNSPPSFTKVKICGALSSVSLMTSWHIYRDNLLVCTEILLVILHLPINTAN
jgi:hypothetical protein